MSKQYELTNIHVCVVSCFPPSQGPLSEYTFSLASALSSSSTISRITIIGDQVGKRETNSDKKLRIKRCWKLDSASTLFRIVSAVARSKPDIVYFNLVFRHFSSNRLKNFMGLLTPSILKILGYPVIITLHSIGDAFELTQIGYKDSLINKVGMKLATKALLSADQLTLTHYHFVRILRQKYNAKNVIFVPLGVYDAPLPSCNCTGNRLLLFGKMGPYKNLQLVLDAYSEISSTHQSVELVVAGSSHPLHHGYLESIKNYYPNVIFTGYVNEGDIAETFMRASIVLLPYTASVWSSAVFILCAIYGRPVIASDLPDFTELKEQGAGILLFKNGSKRDLSEKMNMLLTDKTMQNKMGEANLQWAKKNNFEKTVDRILQLFQETLANK